MAMMEHIALADETMDAESNGAVTIPHVEQLGDYRVLREVGRGGMGVVYEAEQVSLGRHVALKVLPPQSLRDAKQRRRFEREARAAAKLHHTNIVPVFGVGEQGDTPYYVMQFIQGQGLDAVLDELKRLRAVPRGRQSDADKGGNGTATRTSARRDVSAAAVARSLLTSHYEPMVDDTEAVDSGPIAPIASENGPGSLSSSSLSLPGGVKRGKSKRQTYWEGVARIGHQVADALAYAHGQGIVHRDIKPSNLLLDTKGTVWVADFGLAKASDQQDLTHTGDLLGTLRYMPPEAFAGKSDARGDIYSLGLTLYEMLAFRPAFDESDRGRLVRQVTNEEPPRLKKLNPEVPRDLETIVQKSIERDPNHRYADASDLADDLRRFVDDEPIQARRASVVERVARWGRRNPAVAGLLSAVALLLFSIIGALLYADRQARQAVELQTTLRAEADRRTREALASAKLERQAKAEALDEKLKSEASNKALMSSQDSLRSTLYAAQMNLAKLAWDSGSPASMLDLLAAATPKPGEPDPRGFEWHYWRRKAHGERNVRKLPGLGDDRLYGRHFSPDGRVAVGVIDKRSQADPVKFLVHETATGRLIHTIPIPSGDEGLLAQPVIAFSANGRVAAIGFVRRVSGTVANTANQSWEVKTIVWNLGDGRELFLESEAFDSTSAAPSLSLNGDGSRVAIGWIRTDLSGAGQIGASGSLRILDVPAGRERLHQTLSTEGFYYTALSPDGRLLAASTVGWTGTDVIRSRLLISEVETGRVRFDSGEQTSFRPTMLRFSPDGLLVAVTGRFGSAEGGLMIVDVERGRQVMQETLPSFDVNVLLTFAPDCRSIVVASQSGPPAQVRDARTGRLLHTLSLGASGSDDLVIRPSDGRLLSICGEDLREWDLPQARPASLDAGLVVKSNGSFQPLRMGRQIMLTKGGGQLIAEDVSTDPSKPREFAVYDVATGQVLRRFPIQEPGITLEPTSDIRSKQANSPGTRLAGLFGKVERTTILRLKIWDLTTGRQLATPNRESLGGVPSGSLSLQAWDAAGMRLALSVQQADPGSDGKPVLRQEWSVVIIEAPSGRIVRTIPTGSSSCTPSFRPDGKLLAIGTSVVAGEGRVARVELVDPDSGRIVQTLHGKTSGVQAMVFSPDGRRLAASGQRNDHGTILIWDLTPGASIEPARIDGLGPRMSGLTFSPDGRRLASATTSSTFTKGEVKLWDTATGSELAAWSIEKGYLQDLVFDRDGRQLRVASLARGSGNVSVTLLDGSPLHPEIEAVDLVNRLRPDLPLNAELAAKIESERGLDPAVRATALAMVSQLVELPFNSQIPGLGMASTRRTGAHARPDAPGSRACRTGHPARGQAIGLLFERPGRS